MEVTEENGGLENSPCSGRGVRSASEKQEGGQVHRASGVAG